MKRLSSILSASSPLPSSGPVAILCASTQVRAPGSTSVGRQDRARATMARARATLREIVHLACPSRLGIRSRLGSLWWKGGPTYPQSRTLRSSRSSATCPTCAWHCAQTRVVRDYLAEVGVNAGAWLGLAIPLAIRVLAAVEGVDVGVGAAVEPGRVGVPQPEVQGDQVGVPEVEPRPGLGAALGAQLL
jgi:hypothetical protein